MNTRETFLEMNGISFRRLLASFAISTVTLAAAMASANADDVFMDVTSITPGSTGGFTGKIGCVEVTGSLAGDDPDTQIADVNFGSSWADSVVDGSAIQFSNPAVYTPSNSTGDKVGYLLFRSEGTEIFTITFSEPVTNPVFHIANLDSMIFDFMPSGLSAGDLKLLSGNGGADGDGLAVNPDNPIIEDGDPLTAFGTEATDPIPMFPEARSAYGSVMITGTFTELKIALRQNPALDDGDGGTIQFSLDESNFAENDFQINAAISDAWFFPATSGQGFFIIVWEDQELVFLAWFTYDTERPPQDVTAILGEPGHRWLTALGPFDGETALLDVFLSSGMVFDSAEPAVTTEQLEGATIEITWCDCKQGTLKYDIPSLGLSGEIPIQRIVEDKVAACEAAQPQ